MGGYGSGRRGFYSKKDTVEDCLAIDINWCIRNGYIKPDHWNMGALTWSRNGEKTSSISYESRCDMDPPYVRLMYTWRKTDEVDFRVYLTTTSPNYGGVRWWFICPLITKGRYCGKRVGKIYSAPGSRYFGCRHCQDLTYTSCQEHDKRIDALVRNPEALLAKLNSNDLNGSLLALKAYYKATGRL